MFQTKQLITADGTYATQTALSLSQQPFSKADSKPILRQLLLEGSFSIVSALANTLTKLVLRFANIKKGFYHPFDIKR
jgi:coatomer subunit beta